MACNVAIESLAGPTVATIFVFLGLVLFGIGASLVCCRCMGIAGRCANASPSPDQRNRPWRTGYPCPRSILTYSLARIQISAAIIVHIGFESARTIALIAMLVAVGPLATDLCLPALPALADGFGAAEARVQLTLSAYIAGFAIGQLAYGPLSDRFGRADRTVDICRQRRGRGDGRQYRGITSSAVVAPQFFFMMAMGMVMPLTLAGAMAPFPHMAGAASSLLGTTQMLIATVHGGLVGHFHTGTPSVMAFGIAFASLAGLLTMRVLKGTANDPRTGAFFSERIRAGETLPPERPNRSSMRRCFPAGREIVFRHGSRRPGRCR